jgi:acetyl-CoA carboxylase carboxyltransferase component
MENKAKYTVARTGDVSTRDCQCSCSNDVTVYYSSGKEAAGQKSVTVKEEAVQIKVLEVK